MAATSSYLAVNSKKAAARGRLDAIKPVENILPTARRVARNDPSLKQLSDELRSEGLDASRSSYVAELGRVAPTDYGFPEQLFGNAELAEQIAAFAKAGLFFFQANPGFQERSLGDRRALGGSASVTRTLQLNDRLLLETPRVVIQFADGTDASDRDHIRKKYGVIAVNPLGFANETEIAAVLGHNALDVCRGLMEEDMVEFAEPDFVENIGKRALNDPDLGKQWHLGQPGTNAHAAWAASTGKGVKVAVIDNGFDTTHGDLQFHTLSGWYRATADMMDADFVRGQGGMPMRDHGTACAGMACARGNNGYGGAGVAYDADLVAIACLSDQIGSQSTMARAVAYAVDPSLEDGGGVAADGADVVVCSLGPNTAVWSISQTLSAAIDYAADVGRSGRGAPVFWACTNGNFPIAADEIASHPKVIAVGRSTSSDDDDGSGFGPELAFLAPGVDVYLPALGNRFNRTTGTSFAAPCAAGVAALVLSVDSTLSARDVRTVLEDSCDKIGALPYVNGRNTRFGTGRVNAARAMEIATAAAAATETGATDDPGSPG